MYCEVALDRREKKERVGKIEALGWKETVKYICESGSKRGGESWWYSAITVKRERRFCCCLERKGRGLSRRGTPIGG